MTSNKHCLMKKVVTSDENLKTLCRQLVKVEIILLLPTDWQLCKCVGLLSGMTVWLFIFQVKELVG